MSSTCELIGNVVVGAIVSTACGFVFDKFYGEQNLKKSALINCVAGGALGALVYIDPITFCGATTGVIGGKIFALRNGLNDAAPQYMLCGALLIGGACHINKVLAVRARIAGLKVEIIESVDPTWYSQPLRDRECGER